MPGRYNRPTRPADTPAATPVAALRSRGAEREVERTRTSRKQRSNAPCRPPERARRGAGHLAPSHPRQRPRGHHPAHTDQVTRWAGASAPPTWTDARGYPRSPATMPGHGRGRAPSSKGRTYPPDPPTTVEVVQLLNGCPDTPIGHRLRALICLLWRTGMRIAEALALLESDLDPVKGSVIVRNGKGGKRRVVGMDPWGWDQLRPWLDERRLYPPGPVFCVLEGPTAGRGWEASQVRFEMHRLARDVGVRKRMIHPHAFRHAFASSRAREQMPWHLLQKQLGHADLRVLSRYLSGISHEDVLDDARIRPLPTLTAPDLLSVPELIGVLDDGPGGRR